MNSNSEGNLRLDSLLVSQDGVHTGSQIPLMIEFVQNGGIFSSKVLASWADFHNRKPSPLIKISEFPDGVKLIQDGHHRSISIYLGGREFLYPEEYVREQWTYERYGSINFVTGWVTPYDPHIEIRLPNIRAYKAKILRAIEQGVPREEIIASIHASSGLYKKPRNVHTVMDLTHWVSNELDQSRPSSLSELLAVRG